MQNEHDNPFHKSLDATEGAVIGAVVGGLAGLVAGCLVANVPGLSLLGGKSLSDKGLEAALWAASAACVGGITGGLAVAGLEDDEAGETDFIAMAGKLRDSLRRMARDDSDAESGAAEPFDIDDDSWWED